jgi:hypothetical protein
MFSSPAAHLTRPARRRRAPHLPRPACSYAEKQVGYVACSVFLNERDEFLRLVINSVRNDLISRNESFQCLALDFTANGERRPAEAGRAAG